MSKGGWRRQGIARSAPPVMTKMWSEAFFLSRYGFHFARIASRTTSIVMVACGQKIQAMRG
jgi:hypothetical protein